MGVIYFPFRSSPSPCHFATGLCAGSPIKNAGHLNEHKRRCHCPCGYPSTIYRLHPAACFQGYCHCCQWNLRLGGRGAGERQQLHVKGHLQQAVEQHQALLGSWPVSPAFQRPLRLGRSCVDCWERSLCLDYELEEMFRGSG